MLTAAVIGCITLIPGFIAFPLAASLRDAGAGYAQIAIFISTLMMVGIATLPACYQSRAWKGSRFALIRAGLNLIAIILLAVIMDKTTSRKDAEALLGLAEKQTDNM